MSYAVKSYQEFDAFFAGLPFLPPQPLSERNNQDAMIGLAASLWIPNEFQKKWAYNLSGKDSRHDFFLQHIGWPSSSASIRGYLLFFVSDLNARKKRATIRLCACTFACGVQCTKPISPWNVL